MKKVFPIHTSSIHPSNLHGALMGAASSLWARSGHYHSAVKVTLGQATKAMKSVTLRHFHLLIVKITNSCKPPHGCDND